MERRGSWCSGGQMSGTRRGQGRGVGGWWLWIYRMQLGLLLIANKGLRQSMVSRLCRRHIRVSLDLCQEAPGL